MAAGQGESGFLASSTPGQQREYENAIFFGAQMSRMIPDQPGIPASFHREIPGPEPGQWELGFSVKLCIYFSGELF